MKPHVINAIHGYALIIVSLYRYYSSIQPSPAVLIPIFLAVVLLVCNSGVEYGHKGMTITAFLSTLVLGGTFAYQSYTAGAHTNTSDVLPLYVLTAIATVSAIRFVVAFVK